MKIKYILAFIIFSGAGCKSGPEKTTPVKENITESVYASGIVKSIDQYQVFPTVSGLIKKILVTEGEVVKKGDSLILIDNETVRLNRENAKLSAEFNSGSANEDKLNELQINIDLARSKMDNDSILLKRQNYLWSNNIGSKIELEQRTLAFQNSSTAYRSALLRYNELKKQINFSSKQSMKNLQISSVIAGDYVIKSDIDGKIYSILKEKGELVIPQMPVAVIGNADIFNLELQIDEYDISKVAAGQKILISMDSYKDQVFEARVTKIDPIMNERSKSFTVEGLFISKPSALYPNLTVEANIIIQTKKNVLTIPRDYLIEDSYVMTSNDEKKKVITGLKDYDKVEIISGLAEGDEIKKPAP